MIFYQIKGDQAKNLSSTEKNILKYIVKNKDVVKNMSIRDLANECYVSTTTIFRFVKKLGFAGYSDFISELQETEKEYQGVQIPQVVKDTSYKNSYLKNIIEAVKVLTDDKIEQFNNIMKDHPQIYILAEGLSEYVGRYMYRMLTTMGYKVMFPSQEYEVKSIVNKIEQDDVIFVLSYDGDNTRIISYLEEILTVSNPIIISFTRADNNIVQNMSNLNFYTFADEITYMGDDITSRCGMAAVFEILIYNILRVKVEG